MGIIDHCGWARMPIWELQDKIQALDQAGDQCAALFFIQTADKCIPGRGYSSKGKSTPEILNASVSLLAGTTSSTVHKLIGEHGVQGVTRRCLFGFYPIYNRNPYEQLLNANSNNNNQFNDSLDIEIHRFYKLFQFLYYKPEYLASIKNNQQYHDDVILKKEIPFINISMDSTIIKYKLEYARNNPTDIKFENIEYPASWLDENGDFRREYLTRM